MLQNMNDCDDTVENVDGDGDGYLDCKGDCDDADAMTYPGAASLITVKLSVCEMQMKMVLAILT